MSDKYALEMIGGAIAIVGGSSPIYGLGAATTELNALRLTSLTDAERIKGLEIEVERLRGIAKAAELLMSDDAKAHITTLEHDRATLWAECEAGRQANRTDSWEDVQAWHKARAATDALPWVRERGTQ